MGVAIFRYFAADRQFCTYTILFLGSNYPKTVELASAK